MAEHDELRPCPFCSGEPMPRTGSDFTKANYSVFCRSCFSSSPVCASEAEARAAWNRRDGEVELGFKLERTREALAWVLDGTPVHHLVEEQQISTEKAREWRELAGLEGDG